jgi:hypothetical protein
MAGESLMNYLPYLKILPRSKMVIIIIALQQEEITS